MQVPSNQVPMALELPQGASGAEEVVDEGEEAEDADIEATGAKAPNNDNRNLYQHPSVAPRIETDAATILPPSLVFYLETRVD